MRTVLKLAGVLEKIGLLLAEQEPSIADNNQERPKRSKETAHCANPCPKDWDTPTWEGV